MSILVPSSSSTVLEPLPSLPPSPTEEDLGGASLWNDAEGNDEEVARHQERLVGASLKGKQRAREVSLHGAEVESDGTLTPTSDARYPPSKDEQDESRRVEENLKRLEQAERLRRKAARESAASTAPSSVVHDVSRRASTLFSSRMRSGSVGARGHTVHTQLGQSSEDALPLTELHHEGSNSLISPTSSPRPPSPTQPSSFRGAGTRSGSGYSHPVPTIVENPFEPPDSATPLHDFPDGESGDMSESAVMRPSSPPPPTPGERTSEGSPSYPFEDGTAEDHRPTLQATSSFSHPQPSMAPPPPLPIDLPPPKTPPPLVGTPGGTPVVTSPPKRVSAPAARSNGGEAEAVDQQDSSEGERRWWTDWLCGCREEKYRDNAGRTNPFE